MEIFEDNFSYFSSKPYVVTPHLNRLHETVQMRYHNIRFYAKLTKIIHNYHQTLPLIWSSAPGPKTPRSPKLPALFSFYIVLYAGYTRSSFWTCQRGMDNMHGYRYFHKAACEKIMVKILQIGTSKIITVNVPKMDLFHFRILQCIQKMWMEWQIESALINQSSRL